MRLVKVKIRRGDAEKGEDQLVYPARYNAVEVDRYGKAAPSIASAGLTMSGDIGRGDEFEYCVIALPDELAEEYASDPDMQIIDEAEADNFLEESRVKNGLPEEQVTDPTRIMAIRAKQDAGLPLTTADIAALNPDSAERGLNKTCRPIADSVKNINNDMSTLSAEKKTFGEKEKRP